MTACWTTLKEVALVMGALAQDVPLPSCPSNPVILLHHPEEADKDQVMEEQANDDKSSVGDKPSALSEEDGRDGGGVVTASQLRRMGDLLLRLLLNVKHSGAVEKAAMGLGALAGRLLR